MTFANKIDFDKFCLTIRYSKKKEWHLSKKWHFTTPHDLTLCYWLHESAFPLQQHDNVPQLMIFSFNFNKSNNFLIRNWTFGSEKLRFIQTGTLIKSWHLSDRVYFYLIWIFRPWSSILVMENSILLFSSCHLNLVIS